MIVTILYENINNNKQILRLINGVPKIYIKYYTVTYPDSDKKKKTIIWSKDVFVLIMANYTLCKTNNYEYRENDQTPKTHLINISFI